ncbi:26S protease regulatory subunit [Frankia sp. QA3]|uniref:ATP-binding protein n=1 Tax=Frankia sp. QA3 TaxID=710111 RepID=UPI000269C51D|nr:ATP-binding protein [Frankia sp. QA3]EIV94377.1 ATP-dependent 26S proteasome regulatory subunit [Frankia sp. QA3]
MLTLTVAPFDLAAFRRRYLDSQVHEPTLTLGELLAGHPALCLQPLETAHLDIPVVELALQLVEPGPQTPLYRPPGAALAELGAARAADGGGDPGGSPNSRSPNSAVPDAGSAGDGPAGDGSAGDGDGAARRPSAVTAAERQITIVAAEDDHPQYLTERRAVAIAHDPDITRAAAYLDRNLSVLIRCEKLLVEHLAAEIAGRSGRNLRQVRPAAAAPGARGLVDPAGGRRAEQLAALQQTVQDAKADDVVVVPHLDLLAGNSDATLTPEARELTDVLYERSDCILLGFFDPSLVIPEVLADRFAVRLAVDILPRDVASHRRERVPVGRALVTREEADLFGGFDDAGLYKYVAGLNAVRLRHAVRFAYHQHRPALGSANPPTFGDLLHELRTFKAKTSSAFEVPTVTFDQIGGYDEVKAELARALDIVGGAAELPEELRHDLVPRGFIFHGPPGTGKTLFAKAIANHLNATILVVSGPEITDKYVGESERKVRDLFAEARRNAPTVIVFDEFDSIAAQRSGQDDGGSRAGNAVVAQLLTELDGFRPEVPVLIIGTTNRIDLIDDALLRPSRFRPVKIDLPDKQARRRIAEVHAKHFGLAGRLSGRLLDAIADATDKMNGDEIRSIFRDARADELVGRPPRAADARRLGELVGALRRAQQERDVGRGQEIGVRRAGRDRTLMGRLTPATAPDSPALAGEAREAGTAVELEAEVRR